MRNIITISREFGSGGRSIGKAVAKELGYEYYDVELIEKINHVREELGKPTVGVEPKVGFVDSSVWERQRENVLEIAERGDCVIVGSCSDYILRDHKDALRVFIHADPEYRANRIVELYGETDEKPEKRLRDKDKRRAENYRYYTDRKWGRSQNYDLTLDSSSLGQERCVKIIAGIAKAE